MYYDTYRGKDRNRGRGREKRRVGCVAYLLRALLKLLSFALVLALLAGGILYILPVGLMNVEIEGAELSLTDGLPGNRVNVLLLGLDFLDGGQQRSDAMMIASVGYDGLRLCSLMRDTMVDIPNHGRGKLNSAYALGGAELAMRTVNQAFQLNITNYVAVDIKTLVDLVDAVGGVEVDVSDAEMQNLNKNAWNTYKNISKQDPVRYAHYASSQPVTQTGKQLLNGMFATGYARIRYTDSDYVRTARQREVISGILSQLRKNVYKPTLYIKLWDVYKNSVSTNLNLAEILSLAEKVLVADKIETDRFPKNEHLQDNGSAIEITDASGNVRSLHEFIYN